MKLHLPVRNKDYLIGDVCRYCGQDCLTWVKEGHRWKLYDGNTIHTCDRAEVERQRSLDFKNN